jgi:flavin-binding protein dodecin
MNVMSSVVTRTTVPATPEHPVRQLRSVSPGEPGEREAVMADSVYTVVELIGTSTDSWEAAASAAIAHASKSLRDLRVAEVLMLDMKIDNGKIIYRAKLSVSFKFHGED